MPDGQGFLTYKAVGSTGRLSDGEEGYLPVLSRRILVTESIALPIRGRQTKTFDFQKTQEFGRIKDTRTSITHGADGFQSLMVCRDGTAVLDGVPHECSEQTFNRLYANSLARHIANSDPKIERVFEQWRATPAAGQSAIEE
ncbi:MAG: hypothetical protein R3C05_16950 [Pirellulaceae bacterium]